MLEIWNGSIDLIMKGMDLLSKNHNYGLGLMLTTVVFRLFFMPFAYLNLKNAQKMKGIQPRLDEISVKYNLSDPSLSKEDLQKRKLLRREIIEESGVKPFTLGCLPLLIQIPFYLAFYQAIIQNEKLMKSEFLWFYLGEKEPYFVLASSLFLVTYWQFRVSSPTHKKLSFCFALFLGLVSVLLPAAVVVYMLVINAFVIFQSFIIRSVLSKEKPSFQQKEIPAKETI